MADWICSQIGAREHYAIPKALQRVGRLEKLYTDLPRAGIKDIESSKYSTFGLGGLLEWYKMRKSTRYEDFIRNGQWFSNQLIKRIQNKDMHDNVFFGYDTGFLEAAKVASEQGALTVLGQMDPGRVEFDIVVEERGRWPGWEDHSPPIPDSYQKRREAEWATADKIIVNSDWSRIALEQQGVPTEKLEVIPLCYEPPASVELSGGRDESEFVVLWLGQVNLRKGIPYVLEAAKLLKDEQVRFEIVGPIKIASEQVAAAPSNVNFVGRVQRSDLSKVYSRADLFMLPTLSDGFAITQLEAMAHGLPVIATPNCGKVVKDGSDGFVIPIRDAAVLAEKIMVLANDKSKHSAFSKNALATSKQFTIEKLSERLLDLA